MYAEKKLLNVKNMILCALFVALIAIGAFIKIPVPVCPFTKCAVKPRALALGI